MSEQSIAQARASVMLYNYEGKVWEHSGRSSGISRIHVYYHPVNNTYRIVGRKVQDYTMVINCVLDKGLKYNEATPTFHQWRDWRQTYGLNFPSKEEAQVFGQAVNTALENLRTGGSGLPLAPHAPAAPRAIPALPAPPTPPSPPATPPVRGGGGGPLAPPPPLKAARGDGGSLADQIAAAKLKKAAKVENEGPRTERAKSRSVEPIGGGMDMLAEMQRKLAARRPRNMSPLSRLSIKDLQQSKSAPHRAPPPKAPLGTSSGQYAPTGSSPGQDGGQPTEEGVISAAKFRFRKTVSRCVNENSNAYDLKGQPPREELPPLFRIGAAPPKPAKPDHLKLTLRRFKESFQIPAQWKRSYGSQFLSPSTCQIGLERDSCLKMVPSLPRIGEAPPKLDQLKYRLKRFQRFQDEMVLSAGGDFAVRSSKQEGTLEDIREEENYDDLSCSVIHRTGDLIAISKEFLDEIKEESYDDVGYEILGNQESVSTANHSSSGVVTSKGGSVSVNGVSLACPPGAVDDPVTIKLTLEEPYKHCGLLVHRGLENDAIFAAPIINCQPNGQRFKKHVTLTIALDSEELKFTDTLFVLHGTQISNGKIVWEEITQDSKFDFEKEELKVEITQFSLIALLLRLSWIHAKDIVTRLSVMSFKYTLSVLFKSNHQHSPYDELALVFMSQDIYQEQFYREHYGSALMQLKRNGFEELGSNAGHDRNFIYNNENLVVSIQLGEDYKPANNQKECFTFSVDSSVWWSSGHVVKLPMKGSSADVKILCGKITVQGQYGSLREDHFCQLNLCAYVRRLLGVENAIFNLKRVTLRLELPEETWNEVVECWQSEEGQLEMILLHWREKQGDTEDLASLKKALKGLEPEEYGVKERGQMHIKHLRELATTFLGLQHKDPNTMRYLGIEIKKLCNSVLRDCCIEMATSKKDLDLITSTKNYARLLVSHRRLPEEIALKHKQLCSSSEESVAESFLMIVPQLVQVIKEIFRDERIPQVQNGLRGVPDESTNKIASDILDAAQAKSILCLVSEVCKILESLCLNNNDNRSTEAQIQAWGGCAMIPVMLYFLDRFFQSTEARKLYKRLEMFSASLRDIMSSPSAFEGSFLDDFHNVAVSLLKFAKFDPSQLVVFELIDPTNSSTTQGNDELKYDKSQETFSQLFWISKESEDELQLEAVAHVHINGHICIIGAFESLIILPESCSESIDRVPIASLSVAVKRECDDSGNLRVTLYSTQKENVRKTLQHLENQLGGDLVDLKRTEIIQSPLKVSSSAKAGTVVRLCLVHKWGSETLVLDKYRNDFVALADSIAGGACVPDPEIAAEIGQLAIKDELPVVPGATSSTVGNQSSSFVMDPSDAELIQRHLHEQRGRVEIHYHQNFLKGHVCVAGKNTSLNMQMPATGQRFLEAGPSAAPHRSITAGTEEEEV